MRLFLVRHGDSVANLETHAPQKNCRGPRALFVFTLLFLTSACAQTVDTFNPGANNYVYAIAPQRDGQIIVGGEFSAVGGVSRVGLVRLSADGVVDSTFRADTDRGVYALGIQRDGKILVAGAFATIQGTARSRLARLHPDGTLDLTFKPAVSDTIWALAIQEDGKILLGGDFTKLAGQVRDHIGRLNIDGSLDTSFNPGADAGVYTLSVCADKSILVGGDFMSIGGKSRGSVALLGADGTVQTGFPDLGIAGYVNCLAVQPDGYILLGGVFGAVGGETHRNLARLKADYTIDSTFKATYWATLESILLQADGKIIVGGLDSSSVIRRFNRDGTLDGSFSVSNVSSGSGVYGLTMQGDGRILVGGGFGSMAMQSRRNLARLISPDPATELLTFNDGRLTWLRGGASPEFIQTELEYTTNGMPWVRLGNLERIEGGWQMSGIASLKEAVIRVRGFLAGGMHHASSWYVERLVGGPVLTAEPGMRTNNAGTAATFSVLDGTTLPNGCQWFKDGTRLEDQLNISGAQAPTLTISNVLGNNAGWYSAVISNHSGTVTSLLAHLTVIDPFIANGPTNQTGNPGDGITFTVSPLATPPLSYQWHKEGVPLEGATSSVLTLTDIQPEDAGSYCVEIRNVFGATTSASADLTVNMAHADEIAPAGCDGAVCCIALQPDGRILVGGEFAALSGQGCTRLGRLLLDGTLDPGFAPMPDAIVNSLIVQPDGKIVVGGAFSTLGGQARPYLARLHPNGLLDESFAPQLDGAVACLAMQEDGEIVVGGRFQMVGEHMQPGIARFHQDGTLDLSFGASANAEVKTITIQPDGKILVGGLFSVLSGESRKWVGRLNEDGMLDSCFQPSVNSSVLCCAVQPDAKILMGGLFTSVCNSPITNLARLNPDGTLDGTFKPEARGNIYALALQTNGKIILGGKVSQVARQPRAGLARIFADGKPDLFFNPLTSMGDGIMAITVSPDGRVLVGGRFSGVAGEARANFTRLTSADPATQSLMLENGVITWLREGAGPEIWRTTFELSTNGSDWVLFGRGKRIEGGWRLSGESLPANPTVRARGFVQHGSSAVWLAETTASFAFQPCPVIRLFNRTVNWPSNTFGFSVSGCGDRVTVIEASADMQNWSDVCTNVSGAAPLFFSEPVSSNSSPRFYRARVQ